MIFHPGIIALLLGSVLMTSMVCYSANQGLRIIRHWDISSGSEQQLELERRTYLVSTIMSYALGFQVLSLFLFIYTADALSPLFVGAMCAAGSLNVNGFGYPAAILKIINSLFAGVWLIVNAADNKAYDYPLIKTKYGLLLLIAPLLVIEAIVQGGYLVRLKPNIITSCCGLLFAEDAKGVAAALMVMPRVWSQTAFCTALAATLISGAYFLLKGKGGYYFSISGAILFPVSIVALISFISIYIYELPTHHCPFCILQREYGYVGYWMYMTLLTGAVCALGVGVLMPSRKTKSLNDVVPGMQKKLALVSILSYSLFALTASAGILFSNLSMAAY